MTETSVFRKFPSIEQANEIQGVLNASGIETVIGDNIAPVDITFSNNTLQNQYEVRIKAADFPKAELALEAYAETFLSQVQPDYYLFQFSDEELYDILAHSDEWSDFDYKLSQKLLKERGRTIDADFLKKLKDDRIEVLSRPEGSQRAWIIAGYILAFLGGIIAVVIGYVLWTFKKTLPNGVKVYAYRTEDRLHGKYIFYLGVVVCVISIIWKLADLK